MFVFGLLHTHSFLYSSFSTNLGSDRSCQQQHHTSDKKTTAWRRYCYYRCLPAAGIAHTLFYPWFIFFSVCFVCFEHWPKNSTITFSHTYLYDRNWSNHMERLNNMMHLLWCLLIWLLCFYKNMLLVVWSVLCIWKHFIVWIYSKPKIKDEIFGK